MVKIYAELIKKGVKTLEEVPEKIRRGKSVSGK